jgi:hypothetical protein
MFNLVLETLYVLNEVWRAAGEIPAGLPANTGL